MKLFNLAKTDKNDVITEIFKSKAVPVGSPTSNRGILVSATGRPEEIRVRPAKSSRSFIGLEF